MTTPRPRGVLAAVPTPFSGDGTPDLDRFVRHARSALASGCDGLNVLGTTGEANSLSPKQRLFLMEGAAHALDGSRMMVGTGTPDLETTIELTRRAHELRFAAALVLPPYYYKNISDDGLFGWFAELVDATRSAPISIYLYNFPQMTGVSFGPALVRRLAEAFPDRIRGAKDSSGDLAYAGELARLSGFDVFPSSETALARAEADGFAGCISATVNVTAPLAARLYATPSDTALLGRVSELRKAISSVPLIPAVKHLVGRIHDDAGYDRVLPPLAALDASEIAFLDGLDLSSEPLPRDQASTAR